jgi:hypothetical protein
VRPLCKAGLRDVQRWTLNNLFPWRSSSFVLRFTVQRSAQSAHVSLSATRKACEPHLTVFRNWFRRPARSQM